MARPKMAGVRKNVVLNANSELRLTMIREAMELPSDAEAIRVALRNYVKLMELQQRGGEVWLKDPQSGINTPLDLLFEPSLDIEKNGETEPALA